MYWLVHWVIVAGAILLTANIVPGIRVTGWGPALLAAVVLGILDVLVKPLLVILTLPLTILTLGLFLFAVNAIVLNLCGFLVPGFEVRGFWASIIGALLISVFAWFGDVVATKIFRPDEPTRMTSVSTGSASGSDRLG
jgi:putative membrane protein